MLLIVFSYCDLLLRNVRFNGVVLGLIFFNGSFKFFGYGNLSSWMEIKCWVYWIC